MSSAKGNIRLARINSQIAHEFTQFLSKEVDDKRLKHAQLTRVDVSKDLSSAKLYVTVADPSLDGKLLAKQLKGIASPFRHHLAQALNLRITPQVHFYFDEQAVKTQALLDILDKL